MKDITAFDLFFTSNIPEHLRFAAFSVSHALWVLASALFVFMVARDTREKDIAQKEKRLLFFAWSIPAIHAVSITGHLLLEIFVEPQYSFLNFLPTNLCTLNVIIMPLAIVKNNKTVLNFLYALSLPGAAMAILTPTTYYYGRFFYLSWSVVLYFIDHAIMVLVPVLAIMCGRFRPDYRYLPRVMAYFLPYVAVIYVANKIANHNWLFINVPEEGTILVLFEAYLGNPGYIAAMAVLLAIVIFCMYLPWYKHME